MRYVIADEKYEGEKPVDIPVDGIKGVARSKEEAEDMLDEGQVKVEAD